MLKQTAVFNVSLQSFGNSVILPAALSERYLFLSNGVLRVANADLVALSLSHVSWLVGVVVGPVLLSWMGVVFGPLLDIWNLFLSL